MKSPQSHLKALASLCPTFKPETLQRAVQRIETTFSRSLRLSSDRTEALLSCRALFSRDLPGIFVASTAPFLRLLPWRTPRGMATDSFRRGILCPQWPTDARKGTLAALLPIGATVETLSEPDGQGGHRTRFYTTVGREVVDLTTIISADAPQSGWRPGVEPNLWTRALSFHIHGREDALIHRAL